MMQGAGSCFPRGRGLVFPAIATMTLAIVAGCSGGTGSSVGTGISPTDDHGDTFATATVLTTGPDGANIRGQINFPRDQDIFRFFGIQGVVHSIQIQGFPAPRGISPEFDLTDEVGPGAVTVQVLDFLGNQIATSNSTAGGSRNDIEPAGFNVDGDTEFVAGDSRVVFVPPIDNTFFIRVQHTRELTGIGDYVVRLGTSQLGFADSIVLQTGREAVAAGSARIQTGARNFTLEPVIDRTGAPDPPFVASDAGILTAGLGVTNVTIDEGTDIFATFVAQPGGGVLAVFADEMGVLDDDTQDQVVHLHRGLPNNLMPTSSLNQQEVDLGEDDPHPFIAELITFGGGARRGTLSVREAPQVQEGIVRLDDGTSVRFPITVELGDIEETAEGPLVEGVVRFDLENVNRSSRGIEELLDENVLRLISGFDWYLDIHVTTDFNVDPGPHATSRPLSDVYSTFEEPTLATFNNVVARDGAALPEPPRGVAGGIEIFFDTSLKLFQVARQSYFAGAPFFDGDKDPLNDPIDRDPSDEIPPPHPLLLDDPFDIPAFVRDPYDPSFIGDRIRAHRGGPGENGPVVVDLGTIPPFMPPPTASLSNPGVTIEEQPGFRNPILQLSDEQAVALREAHYDTGVYLEITDSVSGAPIARADDVLRGLSFFDSTELSGPINPLRADEETYLLSGRGEGIATFATRFDDAGTIEVIVNGERIGVLSDAIGADDLPACGLVGDRSTVATALPPGRYYWHAYGEDGTKWDGYVNVSDGGCETIIFE